MASPAPEDVSKAGNSMPAKLNGLGGSDPELAASRASTPKSTRSERAPKNPVKNGVSLSSSRASTPKSAQSDRTSKSAARNGVSRGGSRQSTPKTQSASKGLPSTELSSSMPESGSNIQSAAENPPLVTRSASKGSPASKNRAFPDAHPGETQVIAQTAPDAPSAETSTPKAQVASNAHSSGESTSKAQSTAKDNASDVHSKEISTPQPDPAPSAQLPKDTSSKRRPRGNPNWIARSKAQSSKPQTTSKRNRISAARGSSSKTRSSSKRNSAAAAHSKDTPSNLSQSASIINSTPEENMPESTGTHRRSAGEPLFSLVPETDSPSYSVNGLPSSENASRSRRQTRKPGHLDTPNHILDTPAQSTPSRVNGIETPEQSAPETGDKRRKRTTRGPRKYGRRTANNAPTSTPKDTPIYSPAMTETQATHSQDIEMADAAPIFNSEPGLDGNTDGPVSPTSNSTGGHRVSGRVRKPTARAMESVGSGRRGRRGRGRGGARGGARGGRPRKQPASQSTVSANGRRLFELAMAAVAPNFKPLADAEDIIEKLRRDYETGKEKENQVPSAPELENNDAAKEEDEYMIVTPDLQLYRPPNTYGDSKLPPPPLRLRTREQAEKDRIFGYPPRIGERNLPRDPDHPFVVEDVDAVVARMRAQKEARQNGISTPSSQTGTPAHQLESTTKHAPLKLRIGNQSISEAVAPPSEPSRKRRRRGADETVEKEEKKLASRKRRQTVAAAPALPESSRKKRRRVADEPAENEEGRTEPKKRRQTEGAVDEQIEPKKDVQDEASVGEQTEPNKNDQTEASADEEETPGKVPRLRLVFTKSKKRKQSRPGTVKRRERME